MRYLILVVVFLLAGCVTSDDNDDPVIVEKAPTIVGTWGYYDYDSYSHTYYFHDAMVFREDGSTTFGYRGTTTHYTAVSGELTIYFKTADTRPEESFVMDYVISGTRLTISYIDPGDAKKTHRDFIRISE